jgi:hypothetical protein
MHQVEQVEQVELLRMVALAEEQVAPVARALTWALLASVEFPIIFMAHKIHMAAVAVAVPALMEAQQLPLQLLMAEELAHMHSRLL